MSKRITMAFLLLTGSVFGASDDVLTRLAKHADRFGTISRQIWENSRTRLP